MHNPSHPFRLRNAYNYWKTVSSNRPFVRRVGSVLFWLPTMVVFTQVGCTMRAVTGNSMQVRSRSYYKQYHSFMHPSSSLCSRLRNLETDFD
jgi:hypothetical protein